MLGLPLMLIIPWNNGISWWLCYFQLAIYSFSLHDFLAFFRHFRWFIYMPHMIFRACCLYSSIGYFDIIFDYCIDFYAILFYTDYTIERALFHFPAGLHHIIAAAYSASPYKCLYAAPSAASVALCVCFPLAPRTIQCRSLSLSAATPQSYAISPLQGAWPIWIIAIGQCLRLRLLQNFSDFVPPRA